VICRAVICITLQNRPRRISIRPLGVETGHFQPERRLRQSRASLPHSCGPFAKATPNALKAVYCSLGGTGSNEPNANSSPDSEAPFGSSVNEASGYVSKTPISSAVIVTQPNLNMYRPGSVTRPSFDQVTLFTGKSRSLRLQPQLDQEWEHFTKSESSRPARCCRKSSGGGKLPELDESF
jgi:hypothetical protein